MNKIVIAFLGLALVGFASCKNSEAKTEDKSTLATPADASVTPVAPPAGAEGVQPAAPAVPTGPSTSIEFKETTYDFGTVKEGEKVTHLYSFKNTGKNPLMISNAKGSCGCTVPEWPKEPIAPGKSGEIKVIFDSSGKGSPEGAQQTKRVTLTANTDPVETYLNIKGIVKKDASAATPAKK